MSEKEANTRREFLGKVGSAVFAGLVISGAELTANASHPESSQAAPPSPFAIAASVDEDILIRMQRDLGKALEKPIAERKWGMVIDTRKCIGCSSCTIGCVMENKLPPGVVYRPVIDMEVGEFPNVTRKYLPRPCMQCENPPCVPVCPVKATWKREDGITVIDYNACIGCRYCITACPYQARTFDFGEQWSDSAERGADGALALRTGRDFEGEPNFEYGKTWDRKGSLLGMLPNSPVGNARKCHFCAHRLDVGMLPMCVTTCIGRATFFGDLNDPHSLVAELIVRNNVMRLKEELGTEPKVYYLM